MRRLFPIALALLVALLVSTSCIISSRSRGRGCPPNHTWRDGRCMHVNEFKKQKHHKGKHKNHRR